MKSIIHRANTRGHANHGWLDSYHSFSFAGYYDPQRMNFGMLRVLNDDVVKPGMGFGTHPHRDMEIISIPLKGALSHKDSMGNKRSIEVGEVQAMSAGTGITHSEFNDSRTDDVNFLQLWIIPEAQGVEPRYFQKEFDESGRNNQFQTLVSPLKYPVDGSLLINQNASIKMVDLEEGKELNYDYNSGSGVYYFLIDGGVTIDGETLNKRDAIGIWDASQSKIKANKLSKLLAIDVPMN